MPHMREPELHHYGAAVLVMGVVALALIGGLLAVVFA